jgi:phosphatidylglycerol---prolipoprotein diacylglyceryl transferase
MFPHWFHIHALGIQMGPQTVATLVAVVVGLALGPWFAERLEGIPRRRAWRIQLSLALAALYGGHLLWVFNQWPYVWAKTKAAGPYDLLAPWQGLHAPGSIIGLLIAGPWIFSRAGVSVGRFADLTTPLVGLCLFIVRLGCFVQGCCWGTRCDLPWCVTFPPGSAPYENQRVNVLIAHGAPHSLAVHPLQLYFAGVALLLCVGSLWLYRRKQYDGQVALWGLLAYAVSSTFLELLRGEFGMRAYVGPLPQLAWLGLMLSATAIGGLLAGEVVLRRRRRAAAPEVPA